MAKHAAVSQKMTSMSSRNDVLTPGISGTAVPGSTVDVGGNGKLRVAVSSARFKDAIKPMGEASGAIFALKPVTFHYKKELDPNGRTQFGLIAEEVEKINPDLVARNGQGKPYAVRYHAVNVMLLNEFLKQHRKVQELEAKRRGATKPSQSFRKNSERAAS
jgi:endosialidase-like protein